MNRKHMTAFTIVIVSVFVVAGTLMINHGSGNQIVNKKEKMVSTESAGRMENTKSENEKKSSDAGEKATKSQTESKKTVQSAPSTVPKPKETSKPKVTPKAAVQKATVSNASKSSATKPSSVKPANNGSVKKQTCHAEPVYGTKQVQTGTRTVTDKAAWTETVVDSQAWDEPVVVGDIYVCNDCGARLPDADALEVHGAEVHNYPPVGYHLEPVYKTVHHEAVTHTVTHPAETHQEPVYATQQVQTGTKNVCN